MRRPVHLLSAVSMATALLAPACGNAQNASGPSTVTVTGATSAASAASGTPSPASAAPATAAGGADLSALLPAPANDQRADGPDPLAENGIHKHFLVSGSPLDVMNAYKATLEGAGWSLTVVNSGGGGGGGGATYTGSNGAAYGVFGGGGYGGTTDVDACAWPAKPADSSCGQRN